MKAFITLVMNLIFWVVLPGQNAAIVDSTSLEELVVTNTKIPTKRNLLAKPLTIITNEEIDAWLGKDLAQLLDNVAGVQVSGANSNLGKDKTIYTRGASGEYTVILIDGQPSLDPSGIGSTIDLRLFALENIDRIEISAGSQSTLYGSDAIAGVINLITKKSDDESKHVTAQTSFGSFNTLKSGACLYGKSRTINYNLGGNAIKSGGMSEAVEPATTLTANDNDGVSSYNLNGEIGIKINPNLNFKYLLQYADFQSDTDQESFVDSKDTYENISLTTAAHLNYQKENTTGNLTYNYTKTDRKFESALFGTSPFNGLFHNIDGWIGRSWNDKIQIIGGVNLQKHAMMSTTTHKIDPSIMILSPYISMLVHPLIRFNIELGTRFNHHSLFGNNWNYTIAASYFLEENIKFFGNLSTGFKAPNLFQLYGGFGGNENLQPTVSRTIEVGLGLVNISRLAQAEIVYFRRNVHDIIAYDFAIGYYNGDIQNDQGIEIKFDVNPLSKVGLTLDYSWLVGELETNNQGIKTLTDNLYRRPMHRLSFQGTYAFNEKWKIQAQIRWIGDRKDLYFDPANFYNAEVVILDSYTYADISVNFHVNKHFRLFMHTNNITNAHFTEIYGFSTSGFNASIGLHADL